MMMSIIIIIINSFWGFFIQLERLCRRRRLCLASERCVEVGDLIFGRFRYWSEDDD